MPAKSRLQGLSEFLEVPRDRNLNNARATAWNNHDLVPLPPSRRTWTVAGFLGFWSVVQLNVVGWQTGSSLIVLGLSVWEAMIVTIIAKILICLIAILNGWLGALWHVGFTVGNRSVWGMRGSYFALVQRIMLSMVWYGSQAWIGGQMASVMLYAIFPSYRHMKNTMPASTHMTTQQFVGFIVFCSIQIPFLYIPPEKTVILFRYCNLFSGATMCSVTIWALASVHGGGPLLIKNSTLHTSSEKAWAIIRGITTVIGGIAVSLTNQSDFNRFAARPGNQIAGQIYTTIIVGVLVTLMGTLTTSAAEQLYGQVLWNPSELAIQWMQSYTPKARTGAFFTGLGFFISTIAVNTVDNGWPGGFDLAGLFPKWINIRRGALLTAAIGIVINPWQFVNSANGFMNVLDGYSVFLGPMVGMMICDFWVVRSRKLKLSHLYMANSDSIYWFHHGFNWRALVSWLVGVAPALPGFINAVQPTISVPNACKEIFYLAYVSGFAISFVVHYFLNIILPVEGLGLVDKQDVFATFSLEEAAALGIAPHPKYLPAESVAIIEGVVRESEQGSLVEKVDLD